MKKPTLQSPDHTPQIPQSAFQLGLKHMDVREEKKGKKKKQRVIWAVACLVRYWFFFFFEFQLMLSVPNNNSLLSNQNTNQF